MNMTNESNPSTAQRGRSEPPELRRWKDVSKLKF